MLCAHFNTSVLLHSWFADKSPCLDTINNRIKGQQTTLLYSCSRTSRPQKNLSNLLHVSFAAKLRTVVGCRRPSFPGLRCPPPPLASGTKCHAYQVCNVTASVLPSSEDSHFQSFLSWPIMRCLWSDRVTVKHFSVLLLTYVITYSCTPADTIMWHSWMDLHWLRVPNVSSTSCVCWCTTAWTERHRDTCLTWQCLSAVPHVVSYAQRQPPVLWYHQLVEHRLETVRLLWQVRERGTVYRQPSARPPNRSFPSKTNLNRIFSDVHYVCDSVACSLTVFSALAIVRTA